MRFDDKIICHDASVRGICRPVRAAALLVFLFLASYAGAQSSHEDLFFAPYAAALFSSDNGFAPGGGIILGVGEGAALGLQVLYAVDAVSLNILEMAFFFRLYLPFARGSTGPFLQLIAGTILFGLGGPPTLPARAGSFSASGAFGWRFPLGAHFYIEPMVRAGYPYLAGGSLSAGMRF